MDSGKAAMVMASIGMAKDGRLPEESPLAVPMQKGSSITK